MRLDVYLSKTLNVTRAKAQHMIDNSFVQVDGKIITKSAYDVNDSTDIIILDTFKFSSLGGDKLYKALIDFNYDLTGKTCVDIGASNGGFTDCMLKNGAKKVYAVDVGECAFDNVLKSDSRVIIKDRTNARYINVDTFGESMDFACIDVSFISLKLILPAVYNVLKDGGDIIALIKPQFEAGSKYLSKKGIVTNEKVREQVCEDIKNFAISLGLKYVNITTAPIKPNKNVEFLIFLYKPIE
ncbi:MAG: TlyA family RNA methyltransferase [Clostridia bacterium]|nr:TlyA family RNA methyltransferase [Clostridia bacterium]